MRWVKAMVITAIVLAIIPTIVLSINKINDDEYTKRVEHKIIINEDNITETVYELDNRVKLVRDEHLDNIYMVTNYLYVEKDGIILNVTEMTYDVSYNKYKISYIEDNEIKNIYFDLNDPIGGSVLEGQSVKIVLYDEIVYECTQRVEYEITFTRDNITEKVYELYNLAKLDEYDRIANLLYVEQAGNYVKLDAIFYDTDPSRRFEIRYWDEYLKQYKYWYLDLDDPVNDSNFPSPLTIALYDDIVTECIERVEHEIIINEDNITETVYELDDHVKLVEYDNIYMVTNYLYVEKDGIILNVTEMTYNTSYNRYKISYIEDNELKSIYFDLNDPIGNSVLEGQNVKIVLYDIVVEPPLSTTELILISLIPLILVSGLLIYQYKELGLKIRKE